MLFAPRFPRAQDVSISFLVVVMLVLGQVRVYAQTPDGGIGDAVDGDVRTAPVVASEVAEEGDDGEGGERAPSAHDAPATVDPFAPAPAETHEESAPTPLEASAPESGAPHDDYPDEYADNVWDADSSVPTTRGHFLLESVQVEGNHRTHGRIIRSYVPLQHGDLVDPEDEDIEAIRWRLLGTGWFRTVTLRLRRGERRGWVVLVVHVRERNTLVIEQLAFGASEGITRTTDTSAAVMPYAGIQMADTNLLGLGLTLRLSILGAQRQQAARVSFVAPHLVQSPMALSVSAFFHNGREFFGNNPLVAIRCPPAPTICDPAVEARNAVVLYRRGGVQIGTGRDLGASTRYRLSWSGETVNVLTMPEAASDSYGTEVRPIDFAIHRGQSYLSVIHVGIFYDRRDDPALPTRGTLVDFSADGATHFLGSDYDFLRVAGRIQRWVPLPWGHRHSLRLGAFAGVIFGDAPFFYLFHAADLTDLVPSRVLQMQLDHRAPPNLLGTSVGEMRTEEVAARVDVEYDMQLYSGTGGVRALNAYISAGLYGLSDLEELNRAVPGYKGASRIPVDLTFDLGLRLDTDIGVFQLGFSNLLGFIQL